MKNRIVNAAITSIIIQTILQTIFSFFFMILYKSALKNIQMMEKLPKLIQNLQALYQLLFMFFIIIAAIFITNKIIYDFIKNLIIENEMKLYVFKQKLKNDYKINDFKYEKKNNILFYLFAPNFTLTKFISENINNIYYEKSLKLINNIDYKTCDDLPAIYSLNDTYKNYSNKQNLYIYYFMPSFVYVFT